MHPYNFINRSRNFVHLSLRKQVQLSTGVTSATWRPEKVILSKNLIWEVLDFAAEKNMYKEIL